MYDVEFAVTATQLFCTQSCLLHISMFACVSGGQDLQHALLSVTDVAASATCAGGNNAILIHEVDLRQKNMMQLRPCHCSNYTSFACATPGTRPSAHITVVCLQWFAQELEGLRAAVVTVEVPKEAPVPHDQQTVIVNLQTELQVRASHNCTHAVTC